jgi:ribosome-binding factor A
LKPSSKANWPILALDWPVSAQVLMAQDARSARVMVTVAGDEAEAERTLEGLTAARNYVRHELAERLRLRQASGTLFPDRSGG